MKSYLIIARASNPEIGSLIEMFHTSDEAEAQEKLAKARAKWMGRKLRGYKTEENTVVSVEFSS